MRILIAIPSCRQHAEFQQAQRDTWIQDVPEDVDVRFFVGHSDSLADDEVPLGEDVTRPEEGPKYGPTIYPTLPEKTKLICRWAALNYDYIFKADTDTLVNVENLLRSGFGNSEYSGGYNKEEAGEFASGGAGYWLSRKSMSVVANSEISHFAEDVCTALALKQANILPVWNAGYRWKPEDAVDKNMITLHLGSACSKKYEASMMHEYYQKIKHDNF